jgi:hypothetical protein
MALSQLDGAGRKSIRKSSVRGLWNVIVIAAFSALGAFAAALAVTLGGGGEFESWLAGIAGFLIALALLWNGYPRPLRSRLAMAGAWGSAMAICLALVWAITVR